MPVATSARPLDQAMTSCAEGSAGSAGGKGDADGAAVIVSGEAGRAGTRDTVAAAAWTGLAAAVAVAGRLCCLVASEGFGSHDI